MSLTIRPAGPDDARTLADLNTFVQALHMAQHPHYFKPPLPSEVAAWFRGVLEQPTTRIWLAEQAGVPVGYVYVSIQARSENPFCYARAWWELDQIVVRPEARRGGVARALIEQVLRAAQQEGAPAVELSSWSFNTEAHAVFRRLGFAPTVHRFRHALAPTPEPPK